MLCVCHKHEIQNVHILTRHTKYNIHLKPTKQALTQGNLMTMQINSAKINAIFSFAPIKMEFMSNRNRNSNSNNNNVQPNAPNKTSKSNSPIKLHVNFDHLNFQFSSHIYLMHIKNIHV